MKILALTAIMLSLASGNSNLEKAEPIEKTSVSQIDRFSLPLIPGMWAYHEHEHEESDCQKILKVMREDDDRSIYRFDNAATLYHELGCHKK